jgi:hypothetical protein
MMPRPYDPKCSSKTNDCAWQPNNRVGEGRHTMRVLSHTTDASSLGSKAPNPTSSATRGYSLTAFSVQLLPRPRPRALSLPVYSNGRQFEPAVILLAVGVVPAFFTVLPRRRGTLGRTRDKADVELKREKLAAESSGRHRIQQNNHTVPV